MTQLTDKEALFIPQHEVPTAVDQLLVTILSWPRPHGSAAELRFRGWLAAHLANPTFKAKVSPVKYLGASSLYVEIPSPGGTKATTLFSCHIDTVDTSIFGILETVNGKEVPCVKELTYDPNFGEIALDKASTVGSCLGADDGVGVWIMLKMIEAGVPGGYIFHTGEECGGIGSRATLAEHLPILSEYEIALAFDRPHNDEVITHQRGQECASQKCALALCERLNKHGFAYKPSAKGVFTDTANYRKVIPECFNLGVGYDRQHGYQETLDYAHAAALLEALCHVDWDSLPIDRDPAKPDPVPKYEPYDYKKWNTPSKGSLFGDFEPKLGKKKGKVVQHSFGPKKAGPPPAYTPAESSFDRAMELTYDDVLLDCDSQPEVVAAYVQDLMVEIAQLRAQVAVLTQFNQRSF